MEVMQDIGMTDSQYKSMRRRDVLLNNLKLNPAVLFYIF